MWPKKPGEPHPAPRRGHEAEWKKGSSQSGRGVRTDPRAVGQITRHPEGYGCRVRSSAGLGLDPELLFTHRASLQAAVGGEGRRTGGKDERGFDQHAGPVRNSLRAYPYVMVNLSEEISASADQFHGVCGRRVATPNVAGPSGRPIPKDVS